MSSDLKHTLVAENCAEFDVADMLNVCEATRVDNVRCSSRDREGHFLKMLGLLKEGNLEGAGRQACEFLKGAQEASGSAADVSVKSPSVVIKTGTGYPQPMSFAIAYHDQWAVEVRANGMLMLTVLSALQLSSGNPVKMVRLDEERMKIIDAIGRVREQLME